MAKKGNSASSIAPVIATPTGAFPREMVVSNDTARPYVIGRKYVEPAGTALVLIASPDEFVRVQTDINQLLSLSPFHAPEKADPSKPPAIRLTDKPTVQVAPVVPAAPVVITPAMPAAPAVVTPPAK